MQAIFESIFSVCYLTGVLAAGILMLKNADGIKLNRFVGTMAVVLAGGDAFHLIPRIIALWDGDMAAHAASLGFGKAVTSVTMTAFYLTLYYVWRTRYGVDGRKTLTVSVWVLAVSRVALCLFPQNRWLDADAPLSWGIYRNIPFTVLGILIIVVFAQKIRETGDKVLRWMPLAIALSFAFYVPVVLWADAVPLLGTLMIPKTLAYVWMVRMGWSLTKTRKPEDIS